MERKSPEYKRILYEQLTFPSTTRAYKFETLPLGGAEPALALGPYPWGEGGGWVALPWHIYASSVGSCFGNFFLCQPILMKNQVFLFLLFVHGRADGHA